MSNQELYEEMIKLEIKISDLRSIVMGQCVTILNILDENRELKKIVGSIVEIKDTNTQDEHMRSLILALETMYEHETKFSD